MRTYTVCVFQDPDEPRFWIGFVPAAQAFSQGDTREHALEMTKDALETVLEHLLETGQPLPNDVGNSETAMRVTREEFELSNIELHVSHISVQTRVEGIVAA
jgi:predicted RNase H-like HicB family nuclease